MEIRCSECQHVGLPADVVQSDSGVLFVCANCGHGNGVDLGGAKPPADGMSDSVLPETRASEATSTSADVPNLKQRVSKRPDWLDDETRARLLPEPGDGLRCPKCLHLLNENATVCSRCGLDTVRARQFAPGDAPWEQPPKGKEGVFEQAELLWRSARENPSHESLEKFVSFVREEGLTELGVRRLREWLVDYPDDEQVVEWLEEIAASFQARIMVARAQAEVSADKFSETTEKFKRVLLVATAAYLTVLLAIALIYFFG